jgi:hypothetical protein
MKQDYTWSYNKSNLPSSIKVEHILKYADVDEIKECIKEYGFDYCKNIWVKKIIPDERFNKLNYFLARFIFNISGEGEDIIKYLKLHNRKRFEGL